MRKVSNISTLNSLTDLLSSEGKSIEPTFARQQRIKTYSSAKKFPRGKKLWYQFHRLSMWLVAQGPCSVRVYSSFQKIILPLIYSLKASFHTQQALLLPT